jgi:predicted DsbA family dithiol-disulfide isomerase
VPVELHLQPFELNPGMPRDGEPIADYAARKHGASAAQMAARQTLIRQRGADAGLALAERTHVYNTFDAHRLLHWAALQGRSLELKRELLQAYHLRRENPASHEVLMRAAAAAGLDAARARDVLTGDAYAGEVRETVQQWRQRGIDSVPSVIIDGRFLIQGGQSAETFEQALRRA